MENEYLLKLNAYGNEDNIWEPKENLEYLDLIKDYARNNAADRTTDKIKKPLPPPMLPTWLSVLLSAGSPSLEDPSPPEQKNVI